jgi:mono/diheme cytochrome c family protein
MAQSFLILTLLVAAIGLSLPARAASAEGATVYATRCVVCHQSDGEGAPGLAPPLAGTLAKRAVTDSGRRYFAQVLISGMVGTIKSRGMKFNGNMPTFAALPDQELAAAISYVLRTFNDISEPFPIENLAAARAAALASADVSKLRARVIAEVGE